MTAYFTARLRVKNPDVLADYSKAAAPIIARFGGKLLFKGVVDDVLFGETPQPILVVFEFPDEGTVQKFYHSAEYQEIASIRNEGAEMVLAIHKAA